MADAINPQAAGAGPMVDPVNPAPKVGAGAKSATPRWMVWGIIGGVMVLLVVVGQKIRQTEFGEPMKKALPRAATLAPKADQEVWIAEAVGQIKSLEKTVDTQNKMLLDLQRDLERVKKDERKGLQGPEGPPGAAVAVPMGKGAPKLAGRPPLPPTALPPPPPIPGLPGPGGRAEVTPVPTVPLPGSGTTPATVPVLPLGKPGMKTGTPSEGGGEGGMPTPTERIRVFKAEPVSFDAARKGRYWVNTGTMIPIQLLSGMDAPARGGGSGIGGVQQNPYPVLMVVNNLAFLPNDFRINLKECFILGEGMGEISSERAQIRVLGLSCVKKNGQATDVALKGVITGEDGKVGLRGRVVMREGALLARSLMAGFVSGLSRAFLPFQQGFFLAQSPQQLLQFPDPQQIGISGMAGGLGRAAELLARFYMAMARSIFPVIEIDAGRKGVLIVTEGKELADTPL